MPENKEAAIKNTSWVIRLTLVGGWSLLCFVLWFLWVGSMVNSPEMQGAENETAVAMATCMATGCMGSVWFGALIVAMVIYMLVRR